MYEMLNPKTAFKEKDCNFVDMNSPVIGKMSTKTGELINLLPKAHLFDSLDQSGTARLALNLDKL